MPLTHATAAADAPSGLEAVLRAARAEERSCAALAPALAALLEVPASYARAVARAAAAADRSGCGNAYHNPAHTRDVVLAWCVLARRHAGLPGAVALGPEWRAAGLLAALGHDLGHDGRGNADPETGCPTPFRLERLAADCMTEILSETGAADLAGCVAACILATDPEAGYDALECPERRVGALAPLADPRCWAVAAMLRDADLMTSAGLSAGEYDRQADLLVAERGGATDRAAASDHFFARIARGGFMSPAGQGFMPRFLALQALNARRVAAGGTTLSEMERQG